MPSSSLDVCGFALRSLRVARGSCSSGPRHVEKGRDDMINGLQVTIPGEEVRRLLEQRMEDHRQRAECWKREQARTPEEQTEDQPALPEHICENEAERHEWRAAVLGFIRDRSNPPRSIDRAKGSTVRRVAAGTGWLEQEEYESAPAWDSDLERLSKKVGEVLPRELAIAARQASAMSDSENRATLNS